MKDRYDEVSMNKLKESLIILSTVAIPARDKEPDQNLSKLSIKDICSKFFSVGTERPKVKDHRSGTYPLEHVPLTKLSQKSAYKLAGRIVDGCGGTEV